MKNSERVIDRAVVSLDPRRKRSHDHAFDHSAIPSPTPNRRETERPVGRTRDYPTMKRSDDFTVGETECLDVDRKPDTIFQFGYSDDPKHEGRHIDEELRRRDRGSKALFHRRVRVMTAITIIFAFLALGVGHHNGLIP